MDILFGMASAFGGWLGVAAGYVLPFLFVIAFVVFFHELGHFLVARWSGVRVESFSIGFGRELFGFTDRHGTRWKVGWLQIGGYVRFWGEEMTAGANIPDTPDPRKAAAGHFLHKGVFTRMAVTFAGPAANFILAAVVFAGIFMTVGVQEATPVIKRVAPDSAAEAAGFQAGDVIVAIDGEAVRNFADVKGQVALRPDQEMEFEVAREGRSLILIAAPRMETATDPFGNDYTGGVLGIEMEASGEGVTWRRLPPHEALWEGVTRTGEITAATFSYIWQIITGRQNADQLGGPVRIAQISGQMAALGLVNLMLLTAVLSVSLGIVNLLPVPVLDGGHLLFYTIEAVRGRPLSEQAQNYGMRAGLVALIFLMVFVTINDLENLNAFSFGGGSGG